MTKERYWGIMACPFLIGSVMSLAMAGFQNQQQLIWAIVANLLTLCVVLCLHFHHEGRIEGIAQVCARQKVLIMTRLRRGAPKRPKCEPPKSELEAAITKFPKDTR